MTTHGPLKLDTFVDATFQENTFLLWTDDAPDAWVIDPGFPPTPERLVAALDERKLELRAIVLTHAHVDHIAGVKPLRAALPDAALWCPEGEQHMLEDPMANLSAQMGLPVTAAPADRLISPGETLTLGSLDFQVLDVSGHSPGGRAYYCPAAGVVFMGDALFAGGIGRTDFPGSAHETLLANIRAHLYTLPGDTTGYAGHGPATTIQHEMNTNPFL